MTTLQPSSSSPHLIYNFVQLIPNVEGNRCQYLLQIEPIEIEWLVEYQLSFKDCWWSFGSTNYAAKGIQIKTMPLIRDEEGRLVQCEKALGIGLDCAILEGWYNHGFKCHTECSHHGSRGTGTSRVLDSAGASRRLSQPTQHYILTSPWPLATPRFTRSDAERVTLIVSTYLRSDSLCYHFRLVLHAQHISYPLYAWYDANRLGLHCTPNPIDKPPFSGICRHGRSSLGYCTVTCRSSRPSLLLPCRQEAHCIVDYRSDRKPPWLSGNRGPKSLFFSCPWAMLAPNKGRKVTIWRRGRRRLQQAGLMAVVPEILGWNNFNERQNSKEPKEKIDWSQERENSSGSRISSEDLD